MLKPYTLAGSLWSRIAVSMVTMVSLTGCPVVPPDGGGDGGSVTDGNVDPSASSPLGKTSGEPNDAFDEPIIAVFGGDGVAQLQGTVSEIGDMDVYQLEALTIGDRIIVDVATTNSSLDVSVGLFDAEGRLAYDSDDRDGSSSRGLDSYVDLIVRHSGNPYYLVVTHSGFAAPGTFNGTYTVEIQIASGAEVPAPAAQVVLLDFDGATLDSLVLGTGELAAFDAGNISPEYEGETETIQAKIVEVFKQNYERFDVVVYTSDDPPPEGTELSVIFFGGFSRSTFGIAESVDLYNADFCDDAIIYAESFTASQFTGTPTPNELGIAIGNVAAHEAGHLLGLNHTDNDLDLMDDRSPADAFIEDQEFMEADLSSDIIPIGTQDGVLLLSEIVGLVEGSSSGAAGAAVGAERRGGWYMENECAQRRR